MASVVNVRVDENTKREVEILFDKLGLNISTAVNMFFKQALIEEALPFQPRIMRKGRDYNPRYILEPDASKTPVLGRLNGLIEIPGDFDEPLEEMKEYMY